MRENVSKLENELALTKQINVLRYQMIQIERESWSTEQYSRRECLTIAGIPETVTSSLLEETALIIFEEIGVSTDPSEIEACHLIGPSTRK